VIKQLRRQVRPLIVVKPETLRSVHQIVQDVEAKRPKSVLGEDNVVSITVHLFNDDDVSCSSIEECLEVPNNAGSRIRSIKISNGYFGYPRISITLGGSSYEYAGASLEINAEPDLAEAVERRFYAVLSDEKTVLNKAISAHPVIVAVLLTLVFQYIVGVFTTEFKALVFPEGKANVEVIFAYVIFLTGFPLMLLFTAIYVLQYRLFGRAVFEWNGGDVRHNNRANAVKWAFFTIPVAMALKLFFE
jgi:hypothetical protein